MNTTIGRPFSPTAIGHPLIPFLGYPVATEDGAVAGVLADVHEDGTATITNESDIVVAVVPAATVHPALSREWSL